MDDTDLKPCPFCGGKAYYRHPEKNKGTSFVWRMVECRRCGACPYAVSVYAYDSEEAQRSAIRKLWNRRQM